MKHLPVHFHGSISLEEIAAALHAAGMHLRDDGRGRILADRVPRFLTRSPDLRAHRPLHLVEKRVQAK